MATTTTKPNLDVAATLPGIAENAWPGSPAHSGGLAGTGERKPSRHDALQGLLAFSALHEQVRRRRALAARHPSFDSGTTLPEFDETERFVLDEVLDLVAQRAVAITGADGLAIALAENNEIVLRASAGEIKPDVGMRIDRDSAFSGACFRMAQIVRCDDTETDSRVNLQACRRLGARSMVAVPLCGRRRVIGLLEAFSAEPFGFNDSDVHSLSLLAELILGALKPEDEDRFAESARVAERRFDTGAVDRAAGAKPAAAAPVETKAKVEAEAKVAPPQTPQPVQQVEPPQAAGAPPSVPVAVTTSVPEKSALAKPVEVVAAPVSSAPVVVTPVLAAPVFAVAPAVTPVAAAPVAVPAVITPKEAATPAVAAATIAQPEMAVAIAVAIAEAIKEAEPQKSTASNHRPLLILMAIVVAVLLAGGVWWKLKNDQIGGVMVKSQKPALKPVQTAPVTTTPQASTAPNVNPETTGAQADSGDADILPSAGDDTPATPQELSKFPRVTGIREWSSADSTTVVLDVQDQVQYEAHRLSKPERIFFDLRETALAPELMNKTVEVGDALISRIRVAQPVPGITRVVLETRGNSNFTVSLEPNPYRLVMQVRKIGSGPKGQVNLFPGTQAEKNKMAIVIPPPTKEDLQLRARVPKMRIVVDAGHGGWDMGTVGRRGLLEKDVVLEIAQRLGKLLESRLGSEIIYTRQDDNYIPLDDRAGVANQAQADLFVSIHANNSDLPSARGVETYYTNSFSAPSGKDIDSRDNPSRSKNFSSATLTAAELHDRITQSQRLAASVQRSLYGILSSQNPGLRDRGIKEAGFVVLTESAMPGILAEVSFVSSPTDEQKLRSDGYREQIAEALYKGIARYAAGTGAKGVKIASTGK